MLNCHPVSVKSRKRNWIARQATRLRRWLENKLPRKIGRVFYWLRTHTYNRYHMLDCRCPHNDYSWGWIDRSELVLFASMAILKEYVEKESYQIAWDSDEPHANAYREMMEILSWWEKGRKEEHDAYDKLIDTAFGFEDCTVFRPLPNKPGYSEMVFTKRGNPQWEADCQACADAEAALDQKDQDMLIRLIKIRNFLWS